MANTDGRRSTPDLVKLYYRIGEVSQIVGVQPHVLRYWESEFHSIRPQKSRKGQRVYSRLDVEKLLRVKDLLRNQGFTIAGARRRLQTPRTRDSNGDSRAHPVPKAADPGVEAPPVVSVAGALGPGSERSMGAAAFEAANPEVTRALAVPGPTTDAATNLVNYSRPMPNDGQGPTVGLGVAASSLPLPANELLVRAATPVLASNLGASAKSMRRRLVELRRDVVRMLAELPG